MKLLQLLGTAATALNGGFNQSAPASRMGAEVFFKAASDAGLPTDHDTLNQIVSLVNQGLSPDVAAAQVRGKKGGLLGGLPQPKKSRGLLDSAEYSQPTNQQ